MIHFTQSNAIILWGEDAAARKDKLEEYLKTIWDADTMRQLIWVNAESCSFDAHETARNLLELIGVGQKVNIEIIMGDLSAQIGGDRIRSWVQHPEEEIFAEVDALFNSLLQMCEQLQYVSKSFQMFWLLKGDSARAKAVQRYARLKLAKVQAETPILVFALEDRYQYGGAAPADVVQNALGAAVAVGPLGVIPVTDNPLISVGYSELNGGDKELEELRNHAIANALLREGKVENDQGLAVLWKTLFEQHTPFDTLGGNEKKDVWDYLDRITRQLFPIREEQRMLNRRISYLLEARDAERCYNSIRRFYQLNLQMCISRLEEALTGAVEQALERMTGMLCVEVLESMWSSENPLWGHVQKIYEEESGGSWPARCTVPEVKFWRRKLTRAQIEEYCQENEKRADEYARKYLRGKLAEMLLRLPEQFQPMLKRMEVRRRALESFCLLDERNSLLSEKYSQYSRCIGEAMHTARSWLGTLSLQLVDSDDVEVHKESLEGFMQDARALMDKQNGGAVFSLPFCKVLSQLECPNGESLERFISNYLKTTVRLLRSMEDFGAAQSLYLVNEEMRDIAVADTVNNNMYFHNRDNLALLNIYKQKQSIENIERISHTPAFDMPSLESLENELGVSVFFQDAPMVGIENLKLEEEVSYGEEEKVMYEATLLKQDNEYLIRWNWDGEQAATVEVKSVQSGVDSLAYSQAVSRTEYLHHGGCRIPADRFPYGRVQVFVKQQDKVYMCEGFGHQHTVRIQESSMGFTLTVDSSKRYDELMVEVGKCYFPIKPRDESNLSCTWEDVPSYKVQPMPRQKDVIKII